MTNNIGLKNNSKILCNKRKKHKIVLEKKCRQRIYKKNYTNSLNFDNEKKQLWNERNRNLRKKTIESYRKLEYYYNNLDIIKEKRSKFNNTDKKKNKMVSLVLEWDFDNPCEK